MRHRDRLQPRRPHEALPHRRERRLLPHLLDGSVPPGRQGRRGEDRHLRRRHVDHRRAPLREAGRGRRGRALRPRPRHGHDAARRGQGRGGRLQGQGRAEAHVGGRLHGHRHHRPRGQRDRPRRRRQGAGAVRPAARRDHLHQARHAQAPGALARARAHAARHRPRGHRGDAPHPRGRGPRRREHPQERPALLAGRRLGRRHAEHRHQRHPLRHAVAALVGGQPRRPQGRPGQRHRARPRAHAVGDARRSVPRPRAHRRGAGRRREGHQPRRHLLHQQRDPHALRHPGGGQLPAPGAGRAHRRGGGDGRRRAVHHAGARPARAALPHAADHDLAEGQDPGRGARGVRRTPRPADRRRDRAHGDRQLPEPRPDPHPRLPRAAGRRLQPRVPQLHAGRLPPRLVPPAQRRRDRRPRARPGRRRRLQQRARHAGRGHRRDDQALHRAGRHGGGHRLRRHGRRQGRVPESRDPGLSGPRPARGHGGHRHPAGASPRLMRGQLAHPHGAYAGGHRGRPRRRHRRPSGRRPLPRVDVREGDRDRHVLRRLRGPRHLRREQPGEGLHGGHPPDDRGLGAARRRRPRVHPRLGRDVRALARDHRRQARGAQAPGLRPVAVRRQRRQPVLRRHPRVPRGARRRSRPWDRPSTRSPTGTHTTTGTTTATRTTRETPDVALHRHPRHPRRQRHRRRGRGDRRRRHRRARPRHPGRVHQHRLLPAGRLRLHGAQDREARRPARGHRARQGPAAPGARRVDVAAVPRRDPRQRRRHALRRGGHRGRALRARPGAADHQARATRARTASASPAATSWCTATR